MGRYGMLLATSADPATTGMGDYVMIIWMLILAVAFYFMFWRPSKKREKAERQLRNSIQPGDSIVTIGGFVGRVLSVKDDEVVFETGADRTKLTVKKYAIQTRTSPEQASKDKEEKLEEDK